MEAEFCIPTSNWRPQGSIWSSSVPFHCTHSLSSGGAELESTGSSQDDLPAILPMNLKKWSLIIKHLRILRFMGAMRTTRFPGSLIMAKARGKQVVFARPWGGFGWLCATPFLVSAFSISALPNCGFGVALMSLGVGLGERTFCFLLGEKEVLAWWLCQHTTARRQWVSERLGMGDESRVTQPIGRLKRKGQPTLERLNRRLEQAYENHNGEVAARRCTFRHPFNSADQRFRNASCRARRMAPSVRGGTQQ
jgi:hypothetical protein